MVVRDKLVRSNSCEGLNSKFPRATLTAMVHIMAHSLLILLLEGKGGGPCVTPFKPSLPHARLQMIHRCIWGLYCHSHCDSLATTHSGYVQCWNCTEFHAIKTLISDLANCVQVACIRSTHQCVYMLHAFLSFHQIGRLQFAGSHTRRLWSMGAR